ncbi:MAG: HisA/HisF-related TIM barrel protein [Candidatus Helarchaeota archaeon]
MIDVMTIKNKKLVVHGKKGERDKYEPIRGVLTTSTDPVEVAAVFQKLGTKELYVADLDAIMGRNFNLDYLSKIIKETDLQVMVDVGIKNEEQVELVKKSKVHKIIIALETLQSLSQIDDYMSLLTPEQTILSIDLFEGKILSKSPQLNELNPAQIIEKFKAKISEFIILDLARVGSSEGIATRYLEDVKDLIQKHEVAVITGGGVRTIDDILQVENYGVSGVLIATALHDGRITKNDLQRFF